METFPLFFQSNISNFSSTYDIEIRDKSYLFWKGLILIAAVTIYMTRKLEVPSEASSSLRPYGISSPEKNGVNSRRDWKLPVKAKSLSLLLRLIA